MSIPYDAIHAAAVPYMPDGTIKETTTWIAIMLHSITSLKQIKDRNDFLWLKCHPKITLKTLKHEYFTRHPLEEFELKFDRKFPPETRLVGTMAKQNPVKDSRIVVLRAFDEEDIEKEEEIEEDLQVAEALQRKYSGRGATSNDAIDLDDDTSNDEANTPSSTSSSKKRKLDDLAAPHDQQDVSVDLVDLDIEEEEEVGSEMLHLPHWSHLWDPFMSRLGTLPEEYRTSIMQSPWAHCENCGKHMLIKPWTRVGPEHGMLCTSCTTLQLQDLGDSTEIAALQELATEEWEAKRERSMNGSIQNMDADAPLDYAQELGNIHETISHQAEEGYESSVELLDEDAANAQLHAELGSSMDHAVRSSEERLNHVHLDGMTNGIQSHRTATTVEAPPTPPTSDLELIDNGEMDTSSDEDENHIADARNAPVRAESPILRGDLEDEAGAAGDHVDSASEASFRTAKDEKELNESSGGSGETIVREGGGPDRREVVDKWLGHTEEAKAAKDDSDYEYDAEDEDE